MAVDPGLLALMRDDLGPLDGLSEIAMFGGVCFMLNGHMVGGVAGDGAIYRVGKAAQQDGLALPGARAWTLTRRRMGGMVELAAEAMADDDTRLRLTRMALSHARSLPPKDAR